MQSLLILEEDHIRYGVPVQMVQEVISNLRLTPLPGRPAYFAGVMNYKGGVMPVITLAAICQKEQETVTACAVLQTKAGLIGIQASQISELAEITGEKITGNPSEQNNGILKIAEVIRSEGAILVLDIDKTVQAIQHLMA